ncbi:hypothetical protein EV426DRAFT_646220 [Tirmania nivea]|nr:hypothetical protein EV426DRAFT_646220 [Tirmania nivea]
MPILEETGIVESEHIILIDTHGHLTVPEFKHPSTPCRPEPESQSDAGPIPPVPPEPEDWPHKLPIIVVTTVSPTPSTVASDASCHFAACPCRNQMWTMNSEISEDESVQEGTAKASEHHEESAYAMYSLSLENIEDSCEGEIGEITSDEVGLEEELEPEELPGAKVIEESSLLQEEEYDEEWLVAFEREIDSGLELKERRGRVQDLQQWGVDCVYLQGGEIVCCTIS